MPEVSRYVDKPFYTLLNERLRSEKRSDLSSWHSYLKLFLTALYKLPSIKKAIWRGIRGDVSHLYQKDYIWWGVSSCTETMEAMEKFVGRKGVRTLFMIECINGKSIQSHSHHKGENEIILMPGTYLRVIGKWSPATGLHMIHLQEEIPPHPLLASPLDSSPSSSSVDTRPLKKLTISKPSQSNNQAASTQSHSKSFFILSYFLKHYYRLKYNREELSKRKESKNHLSSEKYKYLKNQKQEDTKCFENHSNLLLSISFIKFLQFM
jgi:hypothetical protein